MRLARVPRPKTCRCHIGVIAIPDSRVQGKRTLECPLMDARSPDADVTVSRTSAAQTWRPDRCDRIALVLQGGGALGAYQVGVYQALHEAGIEPDWVTGVSIGAINSAIIAGNKPDKRLDALRVFWERITNRKIWHYTPDGDIFRQWRNLY